MAERLAMNIASWGGMAQGPFAVGFKATFVTDHGRLYSPAVIEADKSTSHRSFRSIFVATWYPASPDAEATGAAPMTYGDYLDAPVASGGADMEGKFAGFSERLTDYARNATIEYGLGKKEIDLDDEGRRGLAERESLEFRALHDVPAAPGRFPVVVYHPGLGGSWGDNKAHGASKLPSSPTVTEQADVAAGADATLPDFSLTLTFRQTADGAST